MKKIILNKETVRKLDENVMEKIMAGMGNLANTTNGPQCVFLSACPNKPC